MAFLQAQGNIEPEEMARTFNCGIGMVVIVSANAAEDCRRRLEQAGETVYAIGRIEPRADGEPGTTVE